jgi:hypothetical protein
MATAIAIFAFLPYRQARRGNIVVDTFTSGLPERANAASMHSGISSMPA